MMAKRRILFADDDIVMQRAVRRVAEAEQYEVISVLSGADVQGAALATEPALIVLDVRFPDADGRDILSRLKADRRTADIPVLVWSGRDPVRDRRSALDLGAEDYVEKAPIQTPLSKIHRLLFRLEPV